MKPAIKLLTGLTAAFLTTTAYAQTWTGAALSGNWSDTGNWDVAPTFGSSANVTFYSVAAGNLTNNFTGGNLTVNSLNFNADADSDVTIRTTPTATGNTVGGDLNFSGANAAINVVSGAQGNFTVGGTNGTINLLDNLAIAHSGNGTLIFGRQVAEIGGNRSITKTGSGALQTAGGSGFTGGLIINEGTVIAPSGVQGDLGGGNNTVTISGGTLLFRKGASAVNYSNKNFTTTANTTNTFTYNNTNSTSYALTISGPSYVTTLNGDLLMNNISPGAGDPISYSQNITGPGKIIYEGNNDLLTNMTDRRLQISGNNTGWSGGIEVRKGAFNFTSAESAGTGVVTLGQTGNTTAAGTYLGNDVIIPSDIVVNAGGLRKIEANNTTPEPTFSGNITLNDAAILDLNLNLGSGTNRLRLNGNISGNGSLNLTRTTGASGDYIAFTGNNTYTGNTTINAGTEMRINSASGNGVPDTSDVILAATGSELRITTDETVRSIASTGLYGNLALSATLTTGGTGASTTYGGTFSGNGTLLKAGGGTFTLNGSGTGAGAILLRMGAGTVLLDSSLALATSTVDMNSADSGTLAFGSSVTDATFGGLTGSRNISLVNTSLAPVSLTVGSNNQTTTYSGNLIGGGSFSKNGTGTLTLSGTNTYAGPTTVNAGTLAILSKNSLPGWNTPGAYSVTGGVMSFGSAFDSTDINTILATGNLGDNPTLVIDTTDGDNVLNGDITDPGNGTLSLVKTGPNTLTLGGNNSYSGTTTISTDGTLRITHANALGSTAGGTTIQGGGTSNSLLEIVGLSLAENIVIGGKNNTSITLRNVSGDSELTGNITLGSGGAQYNIESAAGSLTITSNLTTQNTSVRAINITGAGDVTLGGVISDNGGGTIGVTKSGAGTLRLTNNGSIYSRPTTINEGVLEVTTLANGGSPSSIGNSTNDAANLVLAGGTLRFTGSSNATINTDRGFTLAANSTLDASGVGNGSTIFFTGAFAHGGAANEPRTLTLTGTNLAAGGNTKNNINAAINDNGTGAVSIVKNGPGQWNLRGNNGFSGGLFINEGSLQVGATGNGGTVGTGDVTFTNNATLIVSRANQYVMDNQLSGNGSVYFTGGNVTTANLVFTANNTYTGVTRMNFNGGITIGNGGTSGTVGTGNIEINANAANTVSINRSDEVTIPNTITGGGQLAQIGSGTTILTGISAYTGNTTVAAGTLVIGDAGVLGNGTYAGAIDNQTGLVIGTSANQTLSGLISGDGPLTKTGNGTLRITNGGNSFNGTFTIAEGAVLASTYNNFGGNGTFGPAENIYMGSNGTFGRFIYTGGNLSRNKRFVYAAGGGGIVEITDPATTLTFSVGAQGSGSLTKEGPGTLNLASGQVFYGDTNVNEGTLLLNTVKNSGGALLVYGNTTLGGNGTTTNAIISYDGTIAPGLTAEPGVVGTLTALQAVDTTAGAEDEFGNPIPGAPNSTLAIDLVDNACDKLVLTNGNFTPGTFKLAVNATGTQTLPAYVIVDSGNLNNSGPFLEITGVPAGYGVVYNYNDGIDTNNIAIVSGTTLSPFSSYMVAMGLEGAALTDDNDADGYSNLEEFMFDGQPNPANANASAKPVGAPTQTLDATYLTITYGRSQTAMTEPGISVGVEYSTSLATDSWTTAVNGVGGVIITETIENEVTTGFGSEVYSGDLGIDKIEVKIPRSLAPGGKLFARVKINVP